MSMNGRFNTVKLFMVPKEIYRLNAVPIKILTVFFIEPKKKKKSFKNLYGTTKDPEETKQSWERRARLEVSCSLISNYLKAIVIRAVWYWDKNGFVDQWNRIKSLKELTLVWSINLWKLEQSIYNGRRRVSSVNDDGKTGQLCLKERNQSKLWFFQ